MKKQNALTLTVLGAGLAMLGVGCASSGYARYDADRSDMNAAVGGSAQTEMGSASDRISDGTSRAASSTVSALGRSVDTRADWVNRFPFYDQNLRTIELYTFAVPDPDPGMFEPRRDVPAFSVSSEPGTPFIEAAGGAEDSGTERVIQHTPNPSR